MDEVSALPIFTMKGEDRSMRDNFDVEKLLEEIPSITCSDLKEGEPDICSSSKLKLCQGGKSQNAGELENSMHLAEVAELREKDDLAVPASAVTSLDDFYLLDDGSENSLLKCGSGLDLATMPLSAKATVGNRSVRTPRSSFFANQGGGNKCDLEISFCPMGSNSYQALPSPKKLNSDDNIFRYNEFVDFNVQKQEKLLDEFCGSKHATVMYSGIPPAKDGTYSLFQHQGSFYPCIPTPVPQHLLSHNLDERNWGDSGSITMPQESFQQHEVHQIQTDTNPSKMYFMMIANHIEQNKPNPLNHDYVIEKKQNSSCYPQVLGRSNQPCTSLHITKLAAGRSLSYQRKYLAGDHFLNKCEKYTYPDKILTRSNGVCTLRSLRCRPITSNQLSPPPDGSFHICGSSLINLASEATDRENICVNGIAGGIYAMAKDQKGCRYLQSKVTQGSLEVENIFIEIIDHIVDLITDPFGNYLVQKLLDVCNGVQRIHVVYAITRRVGELFSISCDVHGTRVVQKIIETIRTKEEYHMIVSSLKPVIISLMKHSNGNHVVQRCLHHLPPEYNEFLFDATVGHCVELATDRQGCCVLQKFIHKSGGPQQHRLISEIASNSLILSQDQYGNYVVQCILDQRVPFVVAEVLDQLKDNYVHLSLQKYSSNVIEKCLKLATEEKKITILEALISSPQFLVILQDHYGNFVIQQALRETRGSLRAFLVNAIRPHVPVLRHSPYGKKIISSPFFRK